MKKTYSILVLSALLMNVAVAFAQNPAAKLDKLFNEKNKEILVAAHRGDWRNAPENSMNALLYCIDKGFDMMELDVKMTKDSQMVVMHDNTIDRTTNGKGKVSDFTLAELQKLKLKNGLGRVTQNSIPTFKEMMLAAKGKIMINVDKGNDHLSDVFAILVGTGTLDQAIVNVGDNINLVQLKSEEKIPENASIMVVVNMANQNALETIANYKTFNRSVIQPIFNTDTLQNLNELPNIAKTQVVWLNSLWPSLNGGHDDDRAVEQKQEAESWGWLINKKPSILQSDRPTELIFYLKKKKLHK
ncbi:glycerophosphodiester phosphodiesterase family protein [Pedobacter aquatilis]|uniref:glycerophosphodiester phosphodiesterase family protein n=1 Tax=Pedobacter aquatilis TaxID=351343 RepID=UPI00292E0F23|nr:glycerophosphodiester phosphodiesterase family protein [Pedobacter aquatilis]